MLCSSLEENFMSELDQWLIEYGENHRGVDNPGLYWLAVPILIVGTIGLLVSLPIPEAFIKISPFLNWGIVFLAVAVVYYFIISVSLAIGMLPFVLGVATLTSWFKNFDYLLIWISASLTLIAILGLWLGQYTRGGIRAVLQDIQLLMIAPMWLLSNLYRRLGIPY